MALNIRITKATAGITVAVNYLDSVLSFALWTAVLIANGLNFNLRRWMNFSPISQRIELKLILGALRYSSTAFASRGNQIFIYAVTNRGLSNLIAGAVNSWQ